MEEEVITPPRGGGGGCLAPERQGAPRGVRAVPKPFTDDFPEDSLRDGDLRQKDIGSPVDMLVDMVSRIQKDIAVLREENRLLRTLATSQVVQVPWRATLTTTKALQLFSHLEGDALNVAGVVRAGTQMASGGD